MLFFVFLSLDCLPNSVLVLDIFSFSWDKKFIFVFFSNYCLTVETEGFLRELSDVRAKLEPWEKQLIEHTGKLEVASSESKLLKEKVIIDLPTILSEG